VEWLGEFLEHDLVPFVDTKVTPLTLLLFVATVVAAAVLGRLVRNLTMRVLAHRGGGSEGAAYAVGRIGQYLILVGGLLFALDNVGIDITALAALGAVISVGIGFGLQNIAQNFISGVILLVERPVQKGDFVQLGDTEGSVAEIEMRATRVITRDGISVLVPNSKLISDEVRNLSAPSSDNRLRVAVGVAYGSDTALVRETLLEVAARDDRVLDEPAPLVLFREFGESALNFDLCVWLADPRPRPIVSSDLRFAIDRAFRERDITIAFPQRDLHLVSGFDKLRETA